VGIRETLLQFVEASSRDLADQQPGLITEKLMQVRRQIEVKLTLARKAPHGLSNA
jgi:hypothetical protein